MLHWHISLKKVKKNDYNKYGIMICIDAYKLRLTRLLNFIVKYKTKSCISSAVHFRPLLFIIRARFSEELTGYQYFYIIISLYNFWFFSVWQRIHGLVSAFIQNDISICMRKKKTENSLFYEYSSYNKWHCTYFFFVIFRFFIIL